MLVFSIFGLIIIMYCYICIQSITNTESINDNILTSKLINSNPESEYKSQLNKESFNTYNYNLIIFFHIYNIWKNI